MRARPRRPRPHRAVGPRTSCSFVPMRSGPRNSLPTSTSCSWSTPRGPRSTAGSSGRRSLAAQAGRYRRRSSIQQQDRPCEGAAEARRVPRDRSSARRGHARRFGEADAGRCVVGTDGIARDRASLLVGQSGMGKSTLLNLLVPDARVRTQEHSQRLDLGKQTTTASRWFPLPGGGSIVDTPGFQEFGLAHVPRRPARARLSRIPSCTRPVPVHSTAATSPSPPARSCAAPTMVRYRPTATRSIARWPRRCHCETDRPRRSPRAGGDLGRHAARGRNPLRACATRRFPARWARFRSSNARRSSGCWTTRSTKRARTECCSNCSGRVTGPPWRCTACGEDSEPQFGTCWSCGAVRPA